LRYLRRLKIKLAMNMSSKYIWHMLTLPISFYQQRFAGEVANRSELNDKLATLMSGELAQTAIGVVMMGFFALVMFSYDALLTSIGIFFAAVNFVVLRLVSKRRIELNMRVLSEMGKTYGVAIAGLNSIETIKASGLEDDFFQKFGGYFAKGTNAAQALQLSNLVLVILPSLLLGLTTASILVVGAFRVINGDLTIGMLVAFQSLMASFLLPITELSNLGQKFQELRGDLNRVDDVIKYPTPEPIAKRELKDSAGNPVIRLDGKIDLVNVTFGHSPVAKAFFKGIDLTVRPGAAVALVGSSGSGKSTLARLICGDYALWDGQILFDDTPRDEITEQVLANSFSVVDQEVSLFAATVRENLTLWDQTVSNERLRAACDDAAILEVVDNLRNGFDSDILEGGANLSGGQRQRLEIARGLVSRPSIIVLDEATSALDAETESVVMERLRMRGCTAIIVAHRLSTVRDADEILVLSRGKIIERGTHDELWELDEEYVRLMRADEAS
jgi:ABC-type bacteriocin/lantibiotic exporter with double-glycine peptidase domain